ncbi:MAG: GH25 family lysozyme [Christensenella sp.]
MMEIKGIDVSVFQGAIDWKRVKADGVSAAIIKAAQGRAESSNSYLFTDSRFDANIRNAKKAGIKYIGTYYYFTAKNDSESAREAAHYISVIKPYRQYINAFAAVDVESKHLNGMSRAALTSAVNVFYKAVEAAGFPCAVYTNPDFIKNRFDLDGAHRLWLALWRSKSMKPVGYTNMCMWQWGASAVDGIAGKVDANIFYPDEFLSGDKAGADYAGIVCKKCGFDANTRSYIDRYKYASDLWRKLYEQMV